MPAGLDPAIHPAARKQEEGRRRPRRCANRRSWEVNARCCYCFHRPHPEYAVAWENGFFKEGGIDISGFLTSTGGGTSVRNTLASDLPYGEVALSAALEAIKAGQPLKIVNSGVESIGDILWIAKPDSLLNGIKDLAGKRIGFTSPGSVSNMLLLMSLKHAGIDLKSVQIVPAGGVGVLRQAVRAALPAIVTIISVLYGFLIGGAVLVEIVFSWGGAGQYAVQGVLNADVNPVPGFVVFSAVLSLVIYLVVDLIYYALDPRTRG
jgi:NMT1/THI5 like/Binding-protein-dependent transport system inner membrane component